MTGKDINAKARRDWLALQNPTRFGDDFRPKPREQCVKVLCEIGPGEDAKEILIDRERRQRAARRARADCWQGPFLWACDMLMGVTTRYGRRPMVALAWLAAFQFVGAAVFQAAADAGAIKPNTPFDLRSPQWVACAPDYIYRVGAAPPRGRGRESQLDCFLRQQEAAAYPRFNAVIYAADMVFPVLALEMQEFWIPTSGIRWAGSRASGSGSISASGGSSRCRPLPGFPASSNRTDP